MIFFIFIDTKTLNGQISKNHTSLIKPRNYLQRIELILFYLPIVPIHLPELIAPKTVDLVDAYCNSADQAK